MRDVPDYRLRSAMTELEDRLRPKQTGRAGRRFDGPLSDTRPIFDVAPRVRDVADETEDLGDNRV